VVNYIVFQQATFSDSNAKDQVAPQGIYAQQLAERLKPFSPHLQTILRGILRSFADLENPLRFTNTATNLRELLREVFAELAPDQDIKRCSWFVPHGDSGSGVTRRDRVTFAVYSYLLARDFPSNFVAIVDALASEIVASVQRLSSFTHVTSQSLAKTEQEAAPVFEEALWLFLRLFNTITEAREHLRDAVESKLALELAVFFTSEFFDDLDALSTHTRPKDADGIRVQVRSIGPEFVEFSGSGTVYCDLQYGSDGDCRRGDGVEWSDSFPFTFIGQSETNDPHNVSVEPCNVQIDTSAYNDDSYRYDKFVEDS
jgi:hypothetical protein